jgi:hypothetical protein
MTNRRFRQGDVLSYPYRWRHQPPAKIDNPKDRPTCIALMLKDRNGADVLTILPISDLPPDDLSTAIELSPSELAAMGMSDKRRAYIHVSEANVDDVANSFTVTPKTRIIGRLPQPTLKRLLSLLKMQLLTKNIELIHRGRHG